MDLINFTKSCWWSLTNISCVAGQVPPVFCICFSIYFLCLLNLLHLNMKWSVLCSSSSHGHIGLVQIWKGMTLVYACPVVIFTDSGNTGIFCRSLFLTDGMKTLVPAPFPVFLHCCCHTWSPFSFSTVIITSLGILSYVTCPSSTAASLASRSTESFHSIPVCPLTQPKCNVHFKSVSTIILFLISSINRFRLNFIVCAGNWGLPYLWCKQEEPTCSPPVVMFAVISVSADTGAKVLKNFLHWLYKQSKQMHFSVCIYSTIFVQIYMFRTTVSFIIRSS